MALIVYIMLPGQPKRIPKSTMTPKRPVYPFAALVGQERLKLALVLNAINPLHRRGVDPG